MVANQKHQELCLVIVQAEPLPHIRGDALADDTMILLLPLADIVDEQREMQEIFSLDFPVHTSQKAVCTSELFGLTQRQQVVLVYRILVVGIELHEAADSPERRDEPLQQGHSVHGSQRIGCPPRSCEDC